MTLWIVVCVIMVDACCDCAAFRLPSDETLHSKNKSNVLVVWKTNGCATTMMMMRIIPQSFRVPLRSCCR